MSLLLSFGRHREHIKLLRHRRHVQRLEYLAAHREERSGCAIELGRFENVPATGLQGPRRLQEAAQRLIRGQRLDNMGCRTYIMANV